MRTLPLALAAVLSVLAASPVQAALAADPTTTTTTTTAATTTVTITAIERGTPVAGVSIATAPNANRFYVTDANGVAVVTLPDSAKPYTLTASDMTGAKGRVTVLASGGEVAVTIQVTPGPAVVFPSVSLSAPSVGKRLGPFTAPVWTDTKASFVFAPYAYRLAPGKTVSWHYGVSNPVRNPIIENMEILTRPATPGPAAPKLVAASNALYHAVPHMTGSWSWKAKQGLYWACAAATNFGGSPYARGITLRCQAITVSR